MSEDARNHDSTNAPEAASVPPSDERGPRERVYDAEINPLMAQIIAICKRADIPMLANFRLDDDLAITTAVPATTGYGERQQDAIGILYPRPITLALTIATPK